MQNSNRTLIWALVSTVGWIIVIIALYGSGLGQDINYRVANTFEFRMREDLGQSPELSKKIKIFGFDDKTLSRLKRPELYIEEWAEGIKRLAKDKPKVIIVDKMFSIIYDPNHKMAEALEVLRSLDVNIVVGSFVTPYPISYRNSLDINKNLYHMPFIAQNGIHLSTTSKEVYMQIPSQEPSETSYGNDDPYTFFKDFRNQHIYGPSHQFQLAFTYVGHLQYSGHTKAAPFLRIKYDYGVPHASLFAADNFKITEDHLLVNDVPVPIDDDGDIAVNLAHPKSYYVGQKRLNLILDQHRKKNLVDEGDIVLLLLNMYTGGTDFHLTPFGYAPGGFILAAMINSAVTGKWLKQVSNSWLLISISCILGGLLGASTGTIIFWVLLLLGIFFIIGLGIVSFSYFSIIVPWLWIGLGYLCNGMMIFAGKMRYTEKRAQRLQLVEAERKLLAKELQEASVMAEAYRPDSIPNWPSYLIGGYHNPIHAASGDWFAFESSESKKYFHMIMCDITGHGVQAALVVSACKTLLGNIKYMRPELFEDSQFVSHYMKILNGILWKQGKGQHVTTLLGLTFEPEKKLVYYLAAGHPYPLLRKKDQMHERSISLISRHNPIGLCPDCEPKVKEVQLSEDDELLAFTDGIPLLENRRILKKIEARTAENIEHGPKDLYEGVWKMETKKSGKVPEDDVSMVWFKMRGS